MTVVHQCRTLFGMLGDSPSLSGAMMEPLRVVILPQQVRRVTIAPMVTGKQSAASHKRSFLGEPQIGSDYVLKLAMRLPRTQS